MNLLKKIFKGNTLYYPGCMTKFVLKDIEASYKRILKREGIEFILLRDKELCCGSPVKNAGDDEKFIEIADKNLKVFEEHSVSRIITNCPACAAVFKNDYKKFLGEKWNIEVFHIIEIIKIRENFINKISGTDDGKKTKVVTYHDPCHLGRVLGVYDKPRKIIESAGYKLKEMDLCRNKSFCCGGGGGVKSNYPELSNAIAKDRVEQAIKVGAGKLFTACPMCYANLKENGNGIEVEEISRILETNEEKN
jgi:Fe-S oxidoreductase